MTMPSIAGDMTHAQDRLDVAEIRSFLARPAVIKPCEWPPGPAGPAPLIATFVRNTCLLDYNRLGRRDARASARATCIDNYII